MTTLRLTCVAGARPNFVKAAALLHEMGRRPHLSVQLVHTGQHSSPEMSGNLFDDLELPPPDVSLDVSPGTPTAKTAEMMCRLGDLFRATRPDAVLVVGDVNSTLAAALAASQLGIPIAHVEAGLRSHDRTMPEELNRIVTDALSDHLFATEPEAVENLRREGVPGRRVHLVGNVMIDTLLRFRAKASRSHVLERLGLSRRGYVLATLHRPSNVDEAGRLADLIGVLAEIGRRLPVVFPVHPRTRQRLDDSRLSAPGVILIAPLGYLDFMRLTAESRLVMTDSGGIQEETTILGVPCLTLRQNTERPITISEGTNELVGVEPAKILAAAVAALGRPRPEPRRPVLWDGQASARVLDVLEKALNQTPRSTYHLRRAVPIPF